jgi:hypothetical protein
VAPAISSSSSYTIAGARSRRVFPPGGSPFGLVQTKSNWIKRYPYSNYRRKLLISRRPQL